MYTMKDLNVSSMRFKNNSETLEQKKIPEGFSIKAVGNVLGLEGVLLMNIDSGDKEVSVQHSVWFEYVSDKRRIFR